MENRSFKRVGEWFLRVVLGLVLGLWLALLAFSGVDSASKQVKADFEVFNRFFMMENAVQEYSNLMLLI